MRGFSQKIALNQIKGFLLVRNKISQIIFYKFYNKSIDKRNYKLSYSLDYSIDID